MMTREIGDRSGTFGYDMRNFLAAVAMVSAAACSSAKATEGPVESRIVGRGSLGANRSAERQAMLASDAASYEAQWARLVGKGELPVVDFESESVVFLFAGERNTGGYSIEVTGTSVEAEELVVSAVVRGPGPRTIVTQVITYPYAVVAVKAREVKTVRWPQ